MALTSVARIKAFLGLADSDTSKDAQLDVLRSGAEALIKSYTNRDLESATYTEYYSGNNTYTLVLRNKPVTAITSVHVDATGNFGQYTGTPTPFASATQLTYGTDCVLDYDEGSSQSTSGILYRLNTTWPVMPQVSIWGTLVREISPLRGNVKVVYTAGYTAIPDDLQYAVCYLVSYMRRTAALGGPLQSERIGDYSYQLFDTLNRGFSVNQPELGTVRQILAKYRDPAI